MEVWIKWFLPFISGDGFGFQFLGSWGNTSPKRQTSSYSRSHFGEVQDSSWILIIKNVFQPFCRRPLIFFCHFCRLLSFDQAISPIFSQQLLNKSTLAFLRNFGFDQLTWSNIPVLCGLNHPFFDWYNQPPSKAPQVEFLQFPFGIS